MNKISVVLILNYKKNTKNIVIIIITVITIILSRDTRPICSLHIGVTTWDARCSIRDPHVHCYSSIIFKIWNTYLNISEDCWLNVVSFSVTRLTTSYQCGTLLLAYIDIRKDFLILLLVYLINTRKITRVSCPNVWLTRKTHTQTDISFQILWIKIKWSYILEVLVEHSDRKGPRLPISRPSPPASSQNCHISLLEWKHENQQHKFHPEKVIKLEEKWYI